VKTGGPLVEECDVDKTMNSFNVFYQHCIVMYDSVTPSHLILTPGKSVLL